MSCTQFPPAVTFCVTYSTNQRLEFGVGTMCVSSSVPFHRTWSYPALPSLYRTSHHRQDTGLFCHNDLPLATIVVPSAPLSVPSSPFLTPGNQ